MIPVHTCIQIQNCYYTLTGQIRGYNQLGVTVESILRVLQTVELAYLCIWVELVVMVTKEAKHISQTGGIVFAVGSRTRCIVERHFDGLA